MPPEHEQAGARCGRRDYETLFESAPIGYFVLDKEGTVLDVNLYGANLLQANRKTLYGKPFIVFVPEESRRRFLTHLARVFDEARLQSHEMPIVDRRGRRIWGRFESRLQKDDDGSPRCFMAVMDVTERKRMEDDLILAREDAIQASRAKSLFLANMSHEIRTPMNGVLAMSELALESGLSDEQRDWLSIIHDSARHLTRIIDDVLDFSRIEANQLKVENAPFDLLEVINDAERLFAAQAAEKQLQFRIEPPDELHRWYNGDEHRIRQVLHNLLSNAIKFTEHGEVVLSIRPERITKHLSELTFVVRDTGVGIRESQRELIFESFQQGDISYSKAYPGTGLGLTISRRLARLMSGQLYFSSREGSGTTFYFSVPLHLEEDEPEGRPAATQETTATPRAATPLRSARLSRERRKAETERPTRVLVAEDNAINVLVVRTVLERSGYEVATASSGTEALERLREDDIDLILMDIGLPELDGIEATRRIRQGMDNVDPSIPVIAVTAHSMSGDRERFLSAGMDDYLAKPFSKKTMLDIVDRLAARRRNRSEA